MKLTIVGGQDWSEAPDAQATAAWSRAWLAAWNAHDVEAVVNLCHVEVAIDDPAAAVLLHGRDGARRLAAATFAAFPDFVVEEAEPPRVAAASPRVLASYRIGGTMLGPHALAGIAPTAARVDFDAIYECTFRAGLLYRQTGHFNVADVARQLGVLPQRGTRANTMLLRGQHAIARLQRGRRGRA